MKNAQRVRRGVAAWIAIFAMLCQALVPTFAQARADRSPSALVLQLCSASGEQQVVLDDGASKPAPAKSFQTAHCPYCTGTPHFALPPVDLPAAIPARFVNRIYAPLVATPVVKSRKLAAAPPRGPPTLC